MNSRSWWLVVVAALLAAPAFAQKSEEEAGDVSEVDKDASGPLRERIRPVSGHLFLMNQRFEFSPGLGVSVRDAFFRKILFGAAFTYHFTEHWAASLHGGYTLSVISGDAQICIPANSMTGQTAGCRSPTWDELTKLDGQPRNKAYGLNTFVVSIDAQWAPIYGKLSLFAEKVLNFNMYGLAGPAIVMYGPTNTVTLGGNLGVGFRFFINEWVSIRAELRDTIYYESGFPTDSLRNQLMIDFGVSMFFPTIFKEEG